MPNDLLDFVVHRSFSGSDGLGDSSPEFAPDRLDPLAVYPELVCKSNSEFDCPISCNGFDFCVERLTCVNSFLLGELTPTLSLWERVLLSERDLFDVREIPL